MAQRNEAVYQIAQDWIRWLDTRKFMGPPIQKNILAQFMPGKVGRQPNGPMSAKLNAFNLAVMSMDIGDFVPFLVVYCDVNTGRPIKALADDLGIGREAFYSRAHSSASRLIKTMHMLMALNCPGGDDERFAA